MAWLGRHCDTIAGERPMETTSQAGFDGQNGWLAQSLGNPIAAVFTTGCD